MIITLLGSMQLDSELNYSSPANLIFIRRYSLGGKFIIPLPKFLPESFRNAEFVTGDTVLALYPETTCFYRAFVITPPSKVRFSRKY